VIAIVSLLFTLSISLLITRIASVALMLTGLSREVAKFQARSAFSGVGFTSAETESVVNHPVRRRIVSALMLFGNLGIAAVIASTIASFAPSDANSSHRMWQFTALGVGLLLIYFAASSKLVDRWLSGIIEKLLLKWTQLDVRDYVALLRLAEGFVVLEMRINKGDWICGKTLAESRLSNEGVLVLGIYRKSGLYLGSPNGMMSIQEGDLLSLYGPIERLEELDLRKAGHDGDRAHRIAVRVQQEMTGEQVRKAEMSLDDSPNSEGNGQADRPEAGRKKMKSYR
jgi:hypothetical protein